MWSALNSSKCHAPIGKIVADREDFDKWLKLYDIQESVDDVIRIIAGWISKSDQRNDYVVLTWY